MVRTQIYLTDGEHNHLKSLSHRLGRKQSDLIREAVDKLIDSMPATNRLSFLKRGFGLFKNREDLPSAKELRNSWKR